MGYNDDNYNKNSNKKCSSKVKGVILIMMSIIITSALVVAAFHLTKKPSNYKNKNVKDNTELVQDKDTKKLTKNNTEKDIGKNENEDNKSIKDNDNTIGESENSTIDHDNTTDKNINSIDNNINNNNENTNQKINESNNTNNNQINKKNSTENNNNNSINDNNIQNNSLDSNNSEIISTDSNSDNNSDIENTANQETFNNNKKNKINQRIPVKVKGLYVTANAAGSKKLKDLINIAEKKEINTFVIDIKDDFGRITYSMDSQMAKKIGATSRLIPDIGALMKSLKAKNIYTIARIVAFKDPYLASKRHDLALRYQNGTLYRDNKGNLWVNPYKKQVWNYLYEVASNAAKDGFDEIQFDYIRFCNDGKINKLDFGKEATVKSKQEIIVEFTKFIYGKLKPMGVFVSADVFGTIIGSSIDAKIVGQNYIEMSKYLDYICPMIYPSHFGEGNYGIAYPDQHPYEIIKNVLAVSQEKLSKIPKGKHCAIVRPWIQDFTAIWVKHHMKYGGPELKKQIKGVYSAGYGEWLVWNSRANYSINGLKNES